MSWEEAFAEEITQQDRTLLAPTPVVTAEVTAKAEVETALAVLGWNRGVDPISRDLPDGLEASLLVAADLRPDLTTAIGVLEDGLALVERMKETSFAGTSVWDLAVASAPSLQQFVDLARRAKGRLETSSTVLTDWSGPRRASSVTSGTSARLPAPIMALCRTTSPRPFRSTSASSPTSTACGRTSRR